MEHNTVSKCTELLNEAFGEPVSTYTLGSTHACGGRKLTDTQTHDTTIITFTVHAHQGLISVLVPRMCCEMKLLFNPLTSSTSLFKILWFSVLRNVALEKRHIIYYNHGI